ncbi:MAG: DUF4332 domain-containing protein [Geitlerinemataceae cyanobacterium]
MPRRRAPRSTRPPRPLPPPQPLSPGNWQIADLPGLDRDALVALRDRGIRSTRDLLDRCPDRNASDRLAADLQRHPQHVRKWVALARLATVPEVGCRHAGVLLHAGIASPEQLAAAPIHRLYPQLVRLFVATTQRRDLVPDRPTVLRWIAAARAQAAR